PAHYALSLHDALPISADAPRPVLRHARAEATAREDAAPRHGHRPPGLPGFQRREAALPEQARALRHGEPVLPCPEPGPPSRDPLDRKSTRLNSSHEWI